MFANRFTRSLIRSNLRILTPEIAAATKAATTRSTIRSMSGFNSLTPRSLDDILKRDLIANEPKDRMKHVWEEYHRTSASAVGFTLNGMDMIRIASRMDECPMCVWPVFKGKSETDHFMLVSQMQDKFVFCTYLEDYKVDPATASPWICLAMYDDFCSDKDLALIRSDFTPNLTKDEADILVRMIMHAYHDQESYDYIKKFNQSPSEFHFENFHKHCLSITRDLHDDAEARKNQEAIEQMAPIPDQGQ